MAYKLISSSKTEADIENAISWYKDINIELARSFLIELRAAIKYIHLNPKNSQIRYHIVRIARLKKFPFGIHYMIDDEIIIILGVFHTSLSPEKWKERLK